MNKIYIKIIDRKTKILSRDPNLNIDSHQLIQRCKHGDIQAFKIIYETHKTKIYNIAYRIHGNHEDAQDSVQDAFVLIFKKIKSFRGESALSTWFYRIVVNTCLNNIRKSKTQRESSLSDLLESKANNDQNKSLQIILEQEIQNLPTGYRAVFVLYEIEGFTHEEIGKILKISQGTSKSQLHRAKQLLRKRLSPYIESLKMI